MTTVRLSMLGIAPTGHGSGLPFGTMSDRDEGDEGPGDHGEADQVPPGANVWVNCSSSHSGTAGMYFGKGVGPNVFYNHTFAHNPVDIVSDGASDQRFYGTKFLGDQPEGDESPAPRRSRRGRNVQMGFSPRPKGKTCGVCGFEGFRWQKHCPSGHALS